MDYKAKYEEALERAKRWADGTLQPERTTPQGVCEVIFPELAESEDEKIRKKILKTMEASRKYSNFWSDEEIAWVKKQKINTEGDFGRGYDCGYQAGYAVAMNEMKPKVATATLDSEKQKDASKAIEAVERIDSYITEHTANSWEMDDSNPDKKYYCGVDDTLSNIAGILQGVYAKQKEQDKCPEYCVRSHCIGCPIYEKQKEQKQAEWSKEDEEMLNKFINRLNTVQLLTRTDSTSLNFSFFQEIGWLKSLRNRANWKPNKEDEQ